MQVEDRVDRVRIVDVVGGESRRVGRARRLLVRDVPAEVRGFMLQAEELAFLEVLIADRDARLRPRARFGSAGGFSGLKPTWQKPHDIPIRYGGCNAVRIVEVWPADSSFARVEIRIVEPPQADDAGGVPGISGDGSAAEQWSIHRPYRSGARAGLQPGWVMTPRPLEAASVASASPRTSSKSTSPSVMTAMLRQNFSIAGGPEIPGVAADLLVGGVNPMALGVGTSQPRPWSLVRRL